MDDQRFDALTRALAQGSSRRTALKGLFGGLIGGMAVATRFDLAGAQACTNNDDCGPCQVCDEGTCDYPVSIPNGRCCGTEGNYYCAACCDDDDCEGCSTCNGTGQCEPVGCCEDSDCGPCASCSGGTCYGECSQSQQCCNDACIDINACCTDDDCGACSYCSQGTCYGECSQSQECCGDVCVPLGQCAHLCIPAAQPCEDLTLECCPGLQCCIAGDTSYCAACCTDSDCGACEICDSGVCAPTSDCCHREGHTCGVAAADDSPQLDCCHGLVCCDNLYYGASVCAECCVDHDCPHGGHCHEGECKYPHVCKDDGQCPMGTCCCNDGSCSGKCCHYPHPKPSGGGTVTELPVTGAGPSDERNDLIGMAGLGVAATLYAAKKLRETPETQIED